MSYISFENINKQFGTNHVLKDINLEVEKGQLVTLLGPSGCGKSTLLRCLAGLEQVTSGKIFLDGQDITDIPPRRRGIGMVFQAYSLFPNLTVYQNVAYGLKIKKMSKLEIEQKVTQMLDIVGLSDKIKQYPAQLSGGQQQRVALARAMVTEPKVLLLDEPLSAIDALLRKNLQIEIRRIQKQLGITTIFVTHDQDEAMTLSDKIHLFHDGKIEQSATPEEIYAHPATKFAASFIGNYNLPVVAEFNKAFQCDFQNESIAIRPEIIVLSKEPVEKTEQTLVSQGVIKGYTPHGSLTRYNVDFDGLQLNADVLFNNNMAFDVDDRVYASIAKDQINCF
ncbi:MAG: ABC transporter ATP-binding protein [Coriobacteriales bacterium]|nr:ABC transporter ATP-binding protein [Coriobacteriales bacterium]